MQRTFPQAPLVGMAFRPPASDIVNNLPGGCVLRLVLQPENPYDSDAIAVLLYGFSTVEGALHKTLFDYLYKEFEQVAPDKLDLFLDPIQLGYIANSDKTGGKHASSIRAYMVMDGLQECEATLTFSATAKPMVEVKWDSENLNPDFAAVNVSPLELAQEAVAQKTTTPGKSDDEIPF